MAWPIIRSAIRIRTTIILRSFGLAFMVRVVGKVGVGVV